MEAEFEKLLREYQEKEKQYQMVVLQKQQLELQLKEVELAMEILMKSEGDVYRGVGGLFLKTTKEEAERDLKNKKELFELRLKSLNGQEEALRNQLTRMQRQLQELTQTYGGS